MSGGDFATGAVSPILAHLQIPARLSGGLSFLHMDPLTHALAGAVLAAAASKPAHLHAAVLAGAIGAVIPDLDVLIKAADDPLLTHEFHRHFTHSVLLVPVVGALVAVLLRSVTRWPVGLAGLRVAWGWFWWYGALGALTAGLLDACTSYGTYVWWPWVDERIAWAIVAAIDPVITVLLLSGLGLALYRASATFASFSAAAVVCYLLVGAMQHERAAWAARSLAEQRGHAIGELRVKPTLGNLIVWRSIYKADGKFWIDAIRLGVSALAYSGASVMSAKLDEWAPAGSRKRDDIERFKVLSAGYVIAHPHHPHVLGDGRYAMQPDGIAPLWGIDVSGPPHEPVRWRTFRDWDAHAWARFKSMLKGEVVQSAPSDVPYK